LKYQEYEAQACVAVVCAARTMEMELEDTNQEFGNEFWKELTDDVLDTLYSQLEYAPKLIVGGQICLSLSTQPHLGSLQTLKNTT